MGSIVRVYPKLPSTCRDVSWPSPPTPSSKSFFQSYKVIGLTPPSHLSYCLKERPGRGGRSGWGISDKLGSREGWSENIGLSRSSYPFHTFLSFLVSPSSSFLTNLIKQRLCLQLFSRCPFLSCHTSCILYLLLCSCR